MELKQLQHLLAVTQTGSFSRAAEQLGLTQQAISKSIRSLEASVGVTLLERTGRLVAPNEHGRLLVKRATAIAEQVQAFEGDLRQRLGHREGRLRVGTSPSATAPVVTPAILALLRDQPGTHVDVIAGLRRELLPQLEQGLLDIVVCLDIEPQHAATLAREILCHDEYAVFAGARNPLGRRDDVQAAELADRPWILGRNLGDVGEAWRAAWTRARREPPVPLVETTSLEFCRQALARGPYLTILPRGLVAVDVAARRLQVIPVAEFAWERPISLYTHRSVTRSKQLRDFMAALRTAAHAWQA